MEMQINELKGWLKRRAVEIEGKKYVSRVMLKEVLGVAYKGLKKKTDTKKWKKISKKIDGQIYFEVDLITDEMLKHLIKYQKQQEHQEQEEKFLEKKFENIKEKEMKMQRNSFVNREELKEILNALIEAYQELSFHIGKILWRYYDTDKLSYDKFCDVWEKRYKNLQEIKEKLEK